MKRNRGNVVVLIDTKPGRLRCKPKFLLGMSVYGVELVSLARRRRLAYP